MNIDRDSLLNAMDGVARYEAQMEYLRGDPAEVLPKLKQMLETGAARFPHEIKALIEIIEEGRADEVLQERARASARRREQPLPPPPTEAEEIERMVRSVSFTNKINQKYAEHAHRHLVERGAAAVPALVARLYDDRNKKGRFAVLKVLGDIAEQGDESALEAIKTACTHEDRSIAGPAQAVLNQLKS